MGVSVVGASWRSLIRFRTTAIVVGLFAALALYTYGPPATPLLHGAAHSRCNELTGANFRSYHLEWDVGLRPHWLCWDRSDLGSKPIDLGWWVGPAF